MGVVRLRKIEMPRDGIHLRVRDVSGKWVTITPRPLSAHSEKTIQWALLQIKSRYNPDIFGVPLNAVLGAATAGVFLQTDSPEIGAYSGHFDDDNKMKVSAIIINHRNLRPVAVEGKRELVVTLLHELLHFMQNEAEDKSANTEDEAAHDLNCYKALDFPVPADHWALKVLGIDPTKLPDEQKEKE
jgi:hypothetical protein